MKRTVFVRRRMIALLAPVNILQYRKHASLFELQRFLSSFSTNARTFVRGRLEHQLQFVKQRLRRVRALMRYYSQGNFAAAAVRATSIGSMLLCLMRRSLRDLGWPLQNTISSCFMIPSSWSKEL